MKKKLAGTAVLGMMCMGVLTGCGEVGMSGACNPNPSGGYDYWFIVANNVVGQPDESVIIVADNLSPAPTSTGDPHPLTGYEVTRGNSLLTFLNGEPSSSMTYLVQTHPVSNPAATSYNYYQASCV